MIFIALLSVSGKAQKIDAFARVSVAPREVVVRQSFKVTISVYSSTWFAKPLRFENLVIDNAFIIPFTRTVSSISYIKNKKYATLGFYYLVFPYETGALEIPELIIQTSIPPEGESKGKPVTIRSRAERIKVKSIPSTGQGEVWMVAKDVSVNEHWSRDINNLKVGDALERTITQNAKGTLPAFILPLKIEDLDFASIYPKEPILKDKRDEKQANGERIEKYTYLFEKEGEYTLPQEEILWWNPYTQKVYKRTLPQKTVVIAPNPNLAMMASLKDSLQTASALPQMENDEAIPWRRFLVIGILSLLLIYLVIKGLVLAVRCLKSKRKAYLESEAYSFNQVLASLKKNDTAGFIRQMYFWYDQARKPEHSPAIREVLPPDQGSELIQLIKDSYVNDGMRFSSKQKKELRGILREVRRKIHAPEFKGDENTDVNPI